MVYARKFLVICFIVLLAGCCVLGKNTPKDKSYEGGYRLGVKENINDFAEHFYGNDFPYFYWSSPVIQNVRIPAHIENGLFMPEHNEPVVIEPAEWRNKFTYPIIGKKDENETKQTKGGQGYEIECINFGIRDITVLPQSFTCAGSKGEDKDSP